MTAKECFSLAVVILLTYLHCRYIDREVDMITKVQKWGNSLAVRIPRSMAEDTQLSPGETVNLATHDGQIVIAAIRQRKFKLGDLLKGITPRNRHGEVVTGNAVGQEVW
jgi:antitoxin MazE